MDYRAATLLLEKYNKGIATAEEIKLLENWYTSESLNQKLSDKEADFGHLKEEIWAGTLQRANLTDHIVEPFKKKSAATRLWWYGISAAAAIILCLSLLFLQHSKDSFSVNVEIANHISAGRNKATLTLANGRKIVLSDAVKGKLAEETGINITKTADGQLVYEVSNVPADHSLNGDDKELFNTISTAKGEAYQVVLLDGSKVWLNAASSLTYPTSFTGKRDRRVELNGEAYFEVAKDKSHPFRINTNGQEVEVLGTHFNINSYAETGATKTTLLEGAVKVSPLSSVNGKKGAVLSEYAVFLKPGEQAIQKAGSIQVISADTEQAIAWKDGWFYFKSTSLENVLREASKWYNLDVVYEGNIPTDHFTGKVPRSASLGKFIKVLELSDIKFRIEGRKILVN